MLAVPIGARADEVPKRTIVLVSLNAPGGTTDTLARIFSAPISQELGQAIVIENRDGGGTVVGSTIVAEAAPDGYTLLVGLTSTHSFASLTKPNLPYDPIRTSFRYSNSPTCRMHWW